MLVIFSAVAVAQPPFQESELVGQLAVIVPKVEFITQGASFDFHVHAYNSTGHQVFNDTADCYIHVYNNTGNHLIAEEMSYSATNNEWEVELNSTTTENVGMLPYVVWCNTTLAGGFFSAAIDINDVTSVGITSDATHGISITLFILLCTTVFFLLPRLYGTFSENKIVNIIIVRCCYVIGFYLMVMNAGLFSSIAVSAGYATGEIFRYMWLFGTGGYLLMFFTALKTLFDVAELYNQLVKERRGLE